MIGNIFDVTQTENPRHINNIRNAATLETAKEFKTSADKTSIEKMK